ncbi:hypothetical protein EDD86DRAFT_196929 [Gorgonomyces haynaldii]|nr:hypothetical protein EDD86DRAFT_196929 [Gorgonomyces haynaldii]
MKRPLEELISKPSEWIVLLNCSYSSGVHGAVLEQWLKQYSGYKRAQMFYGEIPFVFVEFQSIPDATRFLDSAQVYQPLLDRKVVAEYCYIQPEFPPPALTDPSDIIKAVPGLIVDQDFVNESEETELIDAFVAEGEKGRWQKLQNRNVQHFGFRFDYALKQVDKDALDRESAFPDWIQPLLDRYRTNYPHNPKPDQLTLNHYHPGGGIAPHCDTHSSFLSPLLLISLGSDIIMEFKQTIPKEETVFVVLPKRSLAIMGGDSRYGWEHVIRPRKVDLINGFLHERKDRYSLTFRTVRPDDQPCDCHFKHYCS